MSGESKNVIDRFTLSVVDLSGAKSPSSPKWTGNVSATYWIGLSANLRFIPRVDYSYIVGMSF
jgi:hypothetical protein